MEKRNRFTAVRVGFLICAVMLAAFAFAACGSGDDSTTGSESETTSTEASEAGENVKDVQFTVSSWGAVPTIQVAAEQLGAFEDLSMKMTTINGGAEALPLISSGDMQALGEIGEPPLAIAGAQKIPLKIVWVANDIPEQVLVDPSIKSPKELAGKKIGVPSGTAMQVAVLELLDENGMSADDVEFVDLGGPEIIAAFKSGAIDATAMYPPISTELKAAGAEVIDEFNALQVDTFASSFIEDHPEVVQAWVCGMAEVQEEAREDPANAYKAINEATEIPLNELPSQLPQDLIPAAADLTGEQYLGEGGEIAQKIVSTGEYLNAVDALEGVVSLEEVNAMIDTQFIEGVQNGACE